MHDELEHLRARALALEVLGERRRLVGRLDRAQRDVHLLGRRPRPPARRARRSARPRSAPPAAGAARAATAPTPTRRRRPAGRGSAARNRGRARAGGPRRPADRRDRRLGRRSRCGSRASASSSAWESAPRGTGRLGTRPALPGGRSGESRRNLWACGQSSISPRRSRSRRSRSRSAAGCATRSPAGRCSSCSPRRVAVRRGAAAALRPGRAGARGRSRRRAAPPPPPEPPDDRIDLNRAERRRAPAPAGDRPGRRGPDRRGARAGGPYRSVGDLVRVAGFGPRRVRGLGGR